MFSSCKRPTLFELFFFCFLRASQALVLNSPGTHLFLGSSFQVTWTSAPTDPPSFNLDTVCDALAKFGTATTIPLTSNPVNTGAGVVSVIPSLSQNGPLSSIRIQLDIPCRIRATSIVDGSLLASVDVTVNVGGSPSPPTSSTVLSSISSSILSITQSTSDFTSTVSLTPTITSTSDISPSSTASFVLSTTSNQSTLSLTVLTTETPSTTFLKFSTVEHTTATSNSFTFFGLSSVTHQTISTSGVNPTFIFPTISTFSTDGNAVVTSSTTTPAPQASNDKATHTGAIAGGTAGGVVVLAVFGFIGLILWRRRRNMQNRELEDLNSGVDDEWFGPPPGTRSPGPADFDGPQEMIQHHIYAYPEYSPALQTGYQGPQGGVNSLAREYRERGTFTNFPGAPAPAEGVRRHADYNTHNLSSSSNGSTSGLLPSHA